MARIVVVEFRDGRVASVCQFELEDEEAAFAYAEELSARTSSRLAVGNRASEIARRLRRAMQRHDVDAAVGRAPRISLCMTIVGDSAVTRSVVWQKCGPPLSASSSSTASSNAHAGRPR